MALRRLTKALSGAKQQNQVLEQRLQLALVEMEPWSRMTKRRRDDGGWQIMAATSDRESTANPVEFLHWVRPYLREEANK